MSSVDRRQPLWTPPGELLESSEMARFMAWAAARHDRTFGGYEDLWRWSVEELETFWADIWEFCGVRASRPYEQVLGSHEMPGTSWFEGAALNYAENLLAGRDAAEIAVVHSSELREPAEITWGELSEQVSAAAAGLRSLGVQSGDRVVAYMPNIPETLVAFLAACSIGATWSSAAPEFGARSVIDRFAQIEPKVFLHVDGYRHGGKDFDRRGAVASILAELPTVEHAVLLPYLDGAAEPASGSSAPPTQSWRELLAAGAGAAPEFEQVAFDHPLWVLYSSGTTGLPKAIVQGHGGILIEQLKKRMHMDLRKGDRMFWFTTTGWMMWNFLVGCLHSEAAIVLYDGSPAHPDAGALWALAERAGITCMGVSAGLIASMEKAGVRPAAEYDLSRLRALGSTGSPLSPEGFRWVYDEVGSDTWLFSTSGGTDVCTAFVAGCPLLPVYEGELQCRALGCAVESWDEQGNPLDDEVGELVVTEPMPSMPLYLWGDESGERLHESYFAMYPGVWRHGDWIRITPRGGAVIYGRSDSTINRQGVRMGTSEIYSAASNVGEVMDALVVDVPAAGDDGSLGGELNMILFVVLRDGVELDEALAKRIKTAIREDCSPRHVPNEVRQVAEVPRTLSGKVLEVPVKRILMGVAPEQAASIESLANPKSLDYFVELAQETGRAATRG
ncbi:MAG TPA: acetoacetate--CoA ligase [Solirubrobacteraceae bacterium]|nr:acetoacetate--CoA ligase [Solirubrobacteraceae bacterium]